MGKARSGSKRAQPSTTPEQHNEVVSLLPSERKKRKPSSENTDDASFVGKPIPADEARSKWPQRYSEKDGSEENDCLKAKFHYREANVDGVTYKLNDTAYVKAEDDKPDYIARIVEMFETEDKEKYFTAQWFYRAEDTAIKIHPELIDRKRVFISDVKDENPLDCILRKVKIALITPNVDLAAQKKNMPPCELYYDMKYTVPYLTFSSVLNETSKIESDTSTISSESESKSGSNGFVAENNVANGGSSQNKDSEKEWTLLDLYAGCGAMSTGLCFGASISGINLVTRWAVDINQHACESLKLNHPETHVRNEPAEDFLSLLKEWAKLYEEFVLKGSEMSESNVDADENVKDEPEDIKDEAADDSSDSEEFEVERLLAVCYGDPNSDKKPGVYFKVQWKGYDSSYDTWEPIEGLRDCTDALKDFVTNGCKEKLLPLPGQADFICGGPPCQGISGFNRFRNDKEPLEDVKNKQLLVYMDIIDFLKPKYVLMENVVDLLKFAGGFLGRYAIGRLVAMNYQARMGMMAAGSYGLPQFRMRVFLWGALPNEKLPAYPLPTHDVVSRSVVPTEFEEITVAYPPEEKRQLADAVLLKDAIDDLPAITNYENQDERSYGTKPRTEFQKFIRLKRSEMVNFSAHSQSAPSGMLFDHRPLELNKDDYERVCQVPKKKGANFRDLPGVLVKGNKVEWDPSVERVLLKSGKPLVPDYAMTFVRGTSSKPFRRLWWDEIVNTVVTRAEPHNQLIGYIKSGRKRANPTTIDQSDGTDHHCPQCVADIGGFRCNRNTIHLQCQACGGMMPSRNGLRVPQYCLGCDRPFCGAYWNDQGVTGSSSYPVCSRDILKPITESCIQLMGRTLQDVISEWILKLNNNEIDTTRMMLNHAEMMTVGTLVCSDCYLKLVSFLLYWFCISLPKELLPPEASAKEDCWYGYAATATSTLNNQQAKTEFMGDFGVVQMA